jgi:cysteinyl-tRNA synthetase
MWAYTPAGQTKPLNNGFGLSVYDYPHIGNYRAYITADVLRRYLEYKGFKVKQVMNLTDVDDKTIKGAMQQGKKLDEYTKPYTDAFFEDIKTLNIEPASVYPRATKHVKEMVKLIKQLLKKGYAYKGDDGSIYYSISKFKEYGKLARIKVKELKAGARVRQDEYEKEQANDFALWKAWTREDGDVFWETAVGKGRPGWHIECSVMSMKHLGKTIDIHTGGIDLVFPHHQNEIAQSEAATGKRFVRYWVHNEWLLVEGKKMSKSLGNFYTLRDILNKGYNAKAVRYLLLSTHHRQQLNFTFKGLEAATNTVNGLNDFIRRLRNINNVNNNRRIGTLVKAAKQKFEKAMDNDLNISSALAAVFGFVSKINKLEKDGKIGKNDAEAILKLMMGFDKILGVLDFEEEALAKEIKKLIERREEARRNRNYAEADKIRTKLKEKGIILEDTKQGVRWKRVK